MPPTRGWLNESFQDSMLSATAYGVANATLPYGLGLPISSRHNSRFAPRT